MTPRERVLAVLRGRKPDRIPFTIYENKIPQSAVERDLRNHGMCIVYRRVPAVQADTPNCAREEFTRHEEDRTIVRTVVHTPAGDLMEVHERKGLASRHVEFFFKNPEDYARLRAWVQDQTFHPNYEAFAHAQEWMGDDVFLRSDIDTAPLQKVMVHWMNVETFAAEWVENRDEIVKLMDLMGRKAVEKARLMADAPIVCGNVGGNDIPEMMGPHRYREFTVPVINACAEAFHAKGKLLGSHLDGNNRIWAEIVSQSGLDIIEAFSPAPDTDLSLDEALAAWPNKILWINFPSSLHHFGIERVKETAREFVAAARRTNRVILGITEDFPQENWQKHFLAISDIINSM